MEEKIVVGFTGPIGSGCSTIAKEFFKDKKEYKYASLSEFIKKSVHKKITDRTPNVLDFQDEGNELREKNGNDFVAKQVFIDNNELEDNPYIVLDSIRNLGEVDYLRKKLDRFYLIGVYADRNVRWNRLRGAYEERENIFNRAEERDQGEVFPNGQQVTICMENADVIVINNEDFSKYESPKEELFRKMEKIHSLFKEPGARQPSLREIHMNRALFISLQSRCRKRQVGAIIIDEKNQIVSEGFNRVPDGIEDCEDRVNKCYRDEQREAFKEKISQCAACKTKFQTPEICNNDSCNYSFKKNLKKNVKLLDLCRALHAEEVAISNAYKNNFIKFNDCILYTTTFPCLMCAKKIIDAGIKNIIFIEPYPIEMAREMLEEAKIRFQMFEGVKNIAFFKLFKKNRPN